MMGEQNEPPKYSVWQCQHCGGASPVQIEGLRRLAQRDEEIKKLKAERMAMLDDAGAMLHAYAIVCDERRALDDKNVRLKAALKQIADMTAGGRAAVIKELQRRGEW